MTDPLITIGGVLCAVGVAISSFAVGIAIGARPGDNVSLRRLARRVEALCEHLEVPEMPPELLARIAPVVPTLPPTSLARIAGLVGDGDTIRAIGLYRRLTGTDLPAARDAVLRIRRALAGPDPR